MSTSIKHKREKWAAIYERAAVLIELDSDRFCCCAISRAQNSAHYGVEPTRAAFDYLFHPVENGGYKAFFGDEFVPENQRARVIALLFAAAMARSGAMDCFIKKGGKRA